MKVKSNGYQTKRILPNLSSFANATKKEKEIAKKYTRIVCPSRGRFIPALVIGVQEFRLEPERCNKKEASWVCWMLAKALVGILDYGKKEFKAGKQSKKD